MNLVVSVYICSECGAALYRTKDKIYCPNNVCKEFSKLYYKPKMKLEEVK